MNNIYNFPEIGNMQFDKLASELCNDTANKVLVKAIELINKGVDEANLLVAAIYEFGGKKVEKDISKATFYYKRTIETVGLTEAYLGLGRIYLKNENSYRQAYECYMNVEEINKHPISALMLGKIYEFGLGANQDIDKARYYYKKAKKRGNIFGLTHLGLLEQNNNHYLKGTIFRLIAGIKAFVIVMRNENDDSLRMQ